MRMLCKGKSEPIPKAYKQFNKDTRDGKDMSNYSKLLQDAINSIIDKKEENDILSLFKPGGTTALSMDIKGLDDFELICFLAVK